MQTLGEVNHLNRLHHRQESVLREYRIPLHDEASRKAF